MGNQLLNLLGGMEGSKGGSNGGSMNQPKPTSNFQQMMQQFQQFEKAFQGDPEQNVRQLLNSGKMSQWQLDWIQSTVNWLQRILGR